MSDSRSAAQNDLLESMLGDFLDESEQLLAQLNEKILQLDEWVRSDAGREGPCDAELLNGMFRAAHSLKGLSAMLGLTEINTLTHKIENVFDAARKNELTVTGDVIQLVLAGLDQVDALVERLKDPTRELVDSHEVLDSIRDLLQRQGAERQASTQADADRAMGLSPDVPGEPASGVCQAEPDNPTPPEPSDPLEDVRDEDDISDKYLSIFIDETQVSLDELTAALLALEGEGGPDRLKRVLATAHKIKGSAAAIGLNRLAKMAHLMEDLLENLVESGAPLSPDMADVLLNATDALQRRVSVLRQGVTCPDDFGPMARELLAALTRPPDAETGARATYAGQVTFEPSLPAAGMKARLIYEKLARLGDVSHCDPAPEQLEDLDRLDRFRFRLATERPAGVILDRMRIGGVLETSLEPLDEQPGAIGDVKPPSPETRAEPAPEAVPAPASSAPPAARSASAEEPRGSDAGPRPTETLRVDISRLDHLMDLAGQLVIHKAQFAQIGDKLKAVLSCKQSAQALSRVSAELDRMAGQSILRLDGQHGAAVAATVRSQVRRIQNELEPLCREIQTLSRARDSVQDLLEAIHQLGRVSDAVQQCVMDTRMVPIGPLFARFKRVVRDITRANGRQARLVIRGEQTELDKRMIDELGDPLVHLVRNSVDHGIEPPEARQAAGKPREGTVSLDAFQRGNSVIVEVRDDGRGLDPDRILRKCLEKGLLTKADAEKMTPQQIYQKIWEPGFSTAEKVTEISGRGMGMDIVKSKIEELRGAVEVASVPGRGTTITIKLPLTLAILPSLMVEIGGEVFAIPMEAVTEIVSIGCERISTVQGRQVACLRGRVVCFQRLDELLEFHGARGVRRPSENFRSLQDSGSLSGSLSGSKETTLVIVGEAGQEIGLAVDRVLGEGDVVIKSIAENYRNVPGIAGASILGDGRVALILDVAALAEIVSRKPASEQLRQGEETT